MEQIDANSSLREPLHLADVANLQQMNEHMAAMWSALVALDPNCNSCVILRQNIRQLSSLIGACEAYDNYVRLFR